MDWKIIITGLIQELVGYFGTWITSWLESLFNKTDPPAADDGPIRVGDAPDEVRAKFGKKILDFVTRAFAKFPFVGGVALRYVKNHLDSIINRVWDAYFAKEIASGTVMASATFPVKAMATPLAPLTTEELAKCKAECGLAA